MCVIEQTVNIPAEREIRIQLPGSVPLGRATVRVSVGSLVESNEHERIEELKRQAAEKTERRRAAGKKPFEGLRGTLKTSKTFAGDPVEIVRTLRDEWDVAR